MIDLFPFMETHPSLCVRACVCVCVCNFFLLPYNWRSQRTFKGENIEISSYLISAIFQHVSIVTYLFAGDDKLNRSVRYRGIYARIEDQLGISIRSILMQIGADTCCTPIPLSSEFQVKRIVVE